MTGSLSMLLLSAVAGEEQSTDFLCPLKEPIITSLVKSSVFSCIIPFPLPTCDLPSKPVGFIHFPSITRLIQFPFLFRTGEGVCVH